MNKHSTGHRFRLFKPRFTVKWRSALTAEGSYHLLEKRLYWVWSGSASLIRFNGLKRTFNLFAEPLEWSSICVFFSSSFLPISILLLPRAVFTACSDISSLLASLGDLSLLHAFIYWAAGLVVQLPPRGTGSVCEGASVLCLFTRFKQSGLECPHGQMPRLKQAREGGEKNQVLMLLWYIWVTASQDILKCYEFKIWLAIRITLCNFATIYLGLHLGNIMRFSVMFLHLKLFLKFLWRNKNRNKQTFAAILYRTILKWIAYLR